MCTFLALWLGAIALAPGRLAIRAGVGARRRARLPGAARGDPRPVRDRADLAVGLFRDSRARTVARGPAHRGSAPDHAGRGRLVRRWSRVRSPRSWRSGTARGSGPRSRRARRGSAPARPRARRPARGTSPPRKKPTGSRSATGEYAVLRIVGKWWEELCWLFAVMTVWGIVRQRYHPRPLPGSRPERRRRWNARLLLIFAAVYASGAGAA